jgi:hypothetical protein
LTEDLVAAENQNQSHCRERQKVHRTASGQNLRFAGLACKTHKKSAQGQVNLVPAENEN